MVEKFSAPPGGYPNSVPAAMAALASLGAGFGPKCSLQTGIVPPDRANRPAPQIVEEPWDKDRRQAIYRRQIAASLRLPGQDHAGPRDGDAGMHGPPSAASAYLANHCLFLRKRRISPFWDLVSLPLPLFRSRSSVIAGHNGSGRRQKLRPVPSTMWWPLSCPLQAP